MLQQVAGKLVLRESSSLSGKIGECLVKRTKEFGNSMPGISAGIVRIVKSEDEGKEFCLESAHAVYGKRKCGSDYDITRQDKFHIGSCGKSITALVLEDLIHSGDSGFSWDTTIGDIIPNTPTNWKDLSIIDLMSHRSGIDDRFVLNGIRKDSMGMFLDMSHHMYTQILYGTHSTVQNIWKSYFDEQKLLSTQEHDERIKSTRYARLKNILNEQEPSEKYKGTWLYSNVGVSLAAYLAELHTGKSYEKLVKEHIIDQLEVNSIGFGPPQLPNERDKVNQPWGHINSSLFGVENVPIDPEEDILPELINAAGNIHCTMDDWLRLLATNMILARTSPIPRSYQSHVSLKKVTDTGYGCGWVISDRSNKPQNNLNYSDRLLRLDQPELDIALSHDGSNCRWFSVCAIDPKNAFAVAIATNTFHVRCTQQANVLLKDIALLAIKHE